MKPVIVGISGNIKDIPVMSGMAYDAVSRSLSEGVKEAGGLPIVIPVGDPGLAKSYVDMIDKLILSGGQHVDPSFYGQERSVDSDDYSIERDRFELALIEEALRQNKPIFAVCRGMQLVNVALGGTLHQSIENHWQREYQGTAHEVVIRPNSRLSQVFRSGSRINSIHRQSVQRLAPDLVVTARDPRDGTIEAFESRSGRPILGIQWHPELLLSEDEQNQAVFHYLVNQL